VAVSGGKTASRNLWEGNFWDDYAGFDRDGDGVGDTPYQLYGYADRIWMDVPPAQFFKGSPLLEVLDFLERLAPFSEPDLTLEDPRPMMTAKLSGEPLPSTRPRADDSRPVENAAPSAYDLLRQSLGRP